MSNYKKALADAQQEMAEVEAQITDLQRRHAQLETTIAGLKALMGEPQQESDHTLSSAIRSVLMSSNYKDRFIGITEIAMQLRLLRPQHPVNPASIRTILNRFVQSGEMTQGLAAGGNVGYAWGNKTAGRKTTKAPPIGRVLR